MDPATAARSYRSALRAEQARDTRLRVVEAAGRLFSGSGFQSTTMAAIARAAGVSTETVKAAGSKSELLIAAFEVTFSGAEGESTLVDTPVAASAIDVPRAAFLRAVVDVIATANERGHALWTVVLGAALSDEAVAAALERILDQRRADYAMLVAELRSHGAAVADPERAAAELSFLLSPESYQQLVVQSGWTREEYVGWLHQGVVRVAGEIPR